MGNPALRLFGVFCKNYDCGHNSKQLCEIIFELETVIQEAIAFVKNKVQDQSLKQPLYKS